MYCEKCKKDFNGNVCPYCGEEYLPVDEVKMKISKTTSLILFVSLVLILVSFYLPIFIIVSIFGLGGIFYCFRKEAKSLRKKYAFFIVILISLLIFSFGSYMTPVMEKCFGYSSIEKTLKIDLPNKKADDYYRDNGYSNNISYTYFKYQITFEQYESIKNNNNIKEYNSSDWFINIVTEDKSSYLVYDYLKKDFIVPNNKLKFYYIFIQIDEVQDNENVLYFANVYKVEKREYRS